MPLLLLANHPQHWGVLALRILMKSKAEPSSDEEVASNGLDEEKRRMRNYYSWARSCYGSADTLRMGSTPEFAKSASQNPQ